MYCRVLEGKVQPGKMSEVMEIIGQQATAVKAHRGFLFVQALQSGEDFLVVSSWRSEKDLQAYARSELALTMLTRLENLWATFPRVKNFQMTVAVEGDEGFFTHDEGGEG